MDCNLPGSSVRGISQARILAWVGVGSMREVQQGGGTPIPVADAC